MKRAVSYPLLAALLAALCCIDFCSSFIVSSSARLAAVSQQQQQPHFNSRKYPRRGAIFMPSLLIESNVGLTPSQQSALMSEASPRLASLLRKPESYIMVSYKHVPMCFAGTEDPCAYLKVISLGSITPELNRVNAKELTELVTKHTGVDGSRIYLQFEDPERSNFALDGNLFG